MKKFKLPRSFNVLKKKKVNKNYMYKTLPEKYFKHVYIPEKIYEGIKIVAGLKRISIKEATNMLIEDGLSKFMGERLKEHIETKVAIKEERIAANTKTK